MSAPRAGQRMPLSETSRRVWRAVAARGAVGVGSVQLHDHFRGRIDSRPLTAALAALKRGGYLRTDGRKRWGLWCATYRVPLGEEPPAWLDDVPIESDARLSGTARADDVLACARASGTPVWPFGDARAAAADTAGQDCQADGTGGGDGAEPPAGVANTWQWRRAGTAPPEPALIPAPARPAAPGALPLFALDSEGRLSLRGDGDEAAS